MRAWGSSFFVNLSHPSACHCWVQPNEEAKIQVGRVSFEGLPRRGENSMEPPLFAKIKYFRILEFRI